MGLEGGLFHHGRFGVRLAGAVAFVFPATQRSPVPPRNGAAVDPGGAAGGRRETAGGAPRQFAENARNLGLRARARPDGSDQLFSAVLDPALFPEAAASISNRSVCSSGARCRGAGQLVRRHHSAHLDCGVDAGSGAQNDHDLHDRHVAGLSDCRHPNCQSSWRCCSLRA